MFLSDSLQRLIFEVDLAIATKLWHMFNGDPDLQM